MTLPALIARVEALKGPASTRDAETIANLAPPDWPPVLYTYLHWALSENLNAAVALKDALLPGWRWSLNSHASGGQFNGDRPAAWVYAPGADDEPSDCVFGAEHEAPALALVLAVLRAKLAMEATHAES